MSARRSRRPAFATTLLVALAALPPGGCAPDPEITFCQVDGMRVTTAGRTQMWLNPVLYVRVYGGAWLEGSIVGIAVLNGSTVLPGGSFPGPIDYLVDPGGSYQCFCSNAGSCNQGLGPIDITGVNTTALSVRVVISRMGSSGTETVSLPIGRLRPLSAGMMTPSFDCASTHCGR